MKKARILNSFFPAAFWDRLLQAGETLPTEIVSINKKTNRARWSSSATSLEFVKSIVPEPIDNAMEKPAATMKQFLVPPADSDQKVAINENSIHTFNKRVGPEPIANSF